MANREKSAPVRKPSPSEHARPEVSAEAGVAPLKAVNKITYGAGQDAPASAIFTPVSEAERNELLAMGAAVELDETEAKLFDHADATPVADPVDPDALG